MPTQISRIALDRVITFSPITSTMLPTTGNAVDDGPRFERDIMLDANIEIEDNLLVMAIAQQQYAGLEISGLGLVKDGRLLWCGFNTVGTQGSVSSNASSAAILMSLCLKDTGDAPNAQIHTHPRMTCFWSGADLQSQQAIIDEASDASPTGEIYFIVYAAPGNGIGIEYSLTRRVIWHGKKCAYNDGNLTVRSIVIPSGNTSQTKTTHQLTSSSTQKSDNKSANIVAKDDKPSVAAQDDKPSVIEIILYDALPAIATAKTLTEIAESLPKSICDADIADFFDEHNRIDNCLAAQDGAIEIALILRDTDTSDEQKRDEILMYSLEESFAKLATQAEIERFFPERIDYLCSMTAISLGKLLSGIYNRDANELFDHQSLVRAITGYNGWFAEQTYILLPDAIKKKIARPTPSQSDIQKATNLKSIVQSGDLEKIADGLARASWGVVVAMQRNSDNRWLFEVKDGVLYGNVLCEMAYAIHNNKQDRIATIKDETPKDMMEHVLEFLGAQNE